MRGDGLDMACRSLPGRAHDGTREGYIRVLQRDLAAGSEDDICFAFVWDGETVWVYRDPMIPANSNAPRKGR